MSDIVWAINPEVDSLSDLAHRMRRFAEDTLSADDIEVSFKAPDLRQDPRLGPQIRREIFLILKEAVTNIAKHANAQGLLAGIAGVCLYLLTANLTEPLKVIDALFDNVEQTLADAEAHRQQRNGDGGDGASS